MSTSQPLSPRVPELGALDLLVTLAKVGTLGRAAVVHGVTQQAASSRIRRTEHLLGIPLIERSGQGSRLTPAGGLVVEWAERVIGAAHDLEHGVEALRAEANGALAIASSMTVGEYLMPRWLVTCRAEAPRVGISLEVCNSTEACRQVTTGLVDLGFIESPLVPCALRSATIREDELCVVVGRDHRWAHRAGRITVEELAGTPLVEREAGSGTRETLRCALGRLGHDRGSVPPLLELSSTTAIKAAVAAGRAPAVISSLAVRAELREGRLVRVPMPGLDLTRTMRAVWAEGTSLLGAARTFVALARRSEVVSQSGS